MLGALIIVFREVIEAGIIVGIIMAVTKGVAGSRLMAGAGILFALSAGILGGLLVLYSWLDKRAARRQPAWAAATRHGTEHSASLRS